MPEHKHKCQKVPFPPPAASPAFRVGDVVEATTNYPPDAPYIFRRGTRYKLAAVFWSDVQVEGIIGRYNASLFRPASPSVAENATPPKVFTKGQKVREKDELEGHAPIDGKVEWGPDSDNQYLVLDASGQGYLLWASALEAIPEPRWVPVPGKYRWRFRDGGTAELTPGRETLERLEE